MQQKVVNIGSKSHKLRLFVSIFVMHFMKRDLTICNMF